MMQDLIEMAGKAGGILLGVVAGGVLVVIGVRMGARMMWQATGQDGELRFKVDKTPPRIEQEKME